MALTIIWKYDDTPIRFNPLLRNPRINAPIKVPVIRPRPPDKLQPPNTTAAIASNSYPVPAVGCAEERRATSMLPAKAANAPQRAYTVILYE